MVEYSVEQVVELCSRVKKVFPSAEIQITSWRDHSVEPEKLIQELKEANIKGRWVRKIKT